MKWIGQHIWSFISRFRADVYFEAVPDGTIASGKNLGLDSDNKLVKESDTGVTDLHGAGVDGNTNQLLTDDGDGTVTSESTLTYDSETLTIGADDVGVATLARKTHSDNDGGSLTIQGGNATGVNKTGGDVIIDAGEGTGSEAGGRLIFKSHTAGSSGSTSGSTGGKATFDSSGNLSIEGDFTVKGNDIKDDDGTTCITFDSSGNTTIAGTTSGTFSGDLTGNASGTAATVTGGTQAAITTCVNLTTVGTIGTGVWQGTAIASNKLDSDTAHLSGVQTFLGPRTFAAGIIYDGDRSTTPGDGAAIHVDSSDITDNDTSASGTATAFNHVNIENPRVLASNALVTTTNASTVFIKGAPVASTNQTITNAYALNVAAGNVKLGAGLEVGGDLDVTGNVLPGITYVKILPSDFIPDDAGRPIMIDDTGSDRWLESHSTAKMFASVQIPVGFKATHVDVYGSATSAITVYEADVNSKTVTSKGTGNIGTQINITDVTADATNYILIQLSQASGEEVYGGKLTIAKA